MESSGSPAVITSRCRIKYRESSWRVHQFEVWSGDMVCRMAAVRGEGWLLLWAGGGEPRLDAVALAFPATGGGHRAAATALVGDAGAAPALATRLARRLSRPVYLCLGGTFDRFTTPLLERALVAEIKSRPDFF